MAAKIILGDYFYFAIKILRLFGWERRKEKLADGGVNIGRVSGVCGVYGWSDVEAEGKTWGANVGAMSDVGREKKEKAIPRAAEGKRG